MTGSAAPALSLRGISKSFGRHAALSSIDLDITPGEFVGLLGPNGAGKSSLVKILAGVYQPTSGSILLDGEPVGSLAGHPRVGFVHQDLGLINDLSVMENLRLGAPPLVRLGPIVNRKAEQKAAEAALSTVELDIAPSTLVSELSPAEQALVAMARVFQRGARIMFVDEVTSTLPPSDARRVTDTLARSAARGASIVMVTHKLSEVLDVTQRIVLLIDGRLALDRATAGLDHAALTGLLMNHENPHSSAATQPVASHGAGEVLLELRGARRGALGPIDLRLRRGEVTGIGGLPGSGLHDLAFLVHRTTKPSHGEVRLAAGAATALVPPHRESQGGFDDHTVEENMAASALSRWRRPGGLLSVSRQRQACQETARALAVDPPDLGYRFGALSGGNKQKVIFGRAVLRRANVYVLCEPTRGVDVATRLEIYSLIRGLRDDGNAVLVLSSDSADLFTTSDRIAVIYDGVLTPARPAEDISVHELEALL
ncbi:sugar ABC transporter ATP-binding protein [Saccharomonospora sp. NPDC046836]|uniref:sugar ABC transporter ATP-binding protein n=1 Tax=Saccharomonospora sp. NPDC046836 TaxID=3156921 RepID=UPI0033F78DC5